MLTLLLLRDRCNRALTPLLPGAAALMLQVGLRHARCGEPGSREGTRLWWWLYRGRCPCCGSARQGNSLRWWAWHCEPALPGLPTAIAMRVPHRRTQNSSPMLQYALFSTLGGLRGTVRRRSTLAPLEARITGVPGRLPPGGILGAWPLVFGRGLGSIVVPAVAFWARSLTCCSPPSPCAFPWPSVVNGSSTVARTTKRFGDFYRPLAPSDRLYLVRVAVPSLNWTRSFNVTVPASGAGALLNVMVPL